MREEVIHFIWKHQYYNVAKAVADNDESILVLKQGLLNTDAGPDFWQCKIKIGKVEWNGDVEIHLKSSDWDAHKHQFDKAYNKVILYVVWEKDKEVKREDGTRLPTLELKDLTEEGLINNVSGLIDSIQPIPCSTQFNKVSDVVITNVIQRSLVKRLERKAGLVREELANSKGNWNEVAYRLFMKQMGMKVNGDTFYDLSQSVPYRLIGKSAQSQLSVEALLFGTSGLLETAKEDDYIKKLKTEYEFLAHKFNLSKKITPDQWKFLRLRPSNFPTLRLAQASTLLANPANIFELFTEFSDVVDLIQSLKLTVSKYWKTHYRFGKEAKANVPSFGKTSIELLLLNVATPLLAAYALHIDNHDYMEKAIAISEHLKPEKNRIIRKWESLGIVPNNGAETQGLIELYNENCTYKNCLDCGIGYGILTSE